MSEMTRPVAIDRIGTAGLEMTVEASPAELEAVARRLALPAVSRLRCTFELQRLPHSIIAAAGTLLADVTRTCVVSLDEFEQTVTETFAVRFVPAGTESEDDDPDVPDELPYPAGAIDLGEAAVEQLALALDPYPRRPDLPEADDAEAAADNPFAGLASLKRPQ